MAESYDYISFLFGVCNQWNNDIKRHFLLKISVNVRKFVFFYF